LKYKLNFKFDGILINIALKMIMTTVKEPLINEIVRTVFGLRQRRIIMIVKLWFRRK